MKLKNFASLLLAGVMSVSMLTACGNTVSEQPTQPEQPTTTSGVVSAVEAGIKSWNSDLKISVKSSSNMDAAIEKVFDTNTDYKTTKQAIVGTLGYVFDLDGTLGTPTWGLYRSGAAVSGSSLTTPSFVENSAVVTALNNGNSKFDMQDGDTMWSYAIVEVTKANGDANVAAGNVIGEALQSLSNTVTVQMDNNYNKDAYTHMNVDYTMYVTSEDAVMASNSTKTYVVAVLKADYSAVV